VLAPEERKFAFVVDPATLSEPSKALLRSHTGPQDFERQTSLSEAFKELDGWEMAAEPHSSWSEREGVRMEYVIRPSA
jgi:hypothetical protein